MTAPTQQVTWVIGACGGGDRVSDRDAVVADEHFSDDQLYDALAFLDGQVLGVLGEAGKDCSRFSASCELEVGLGVVQFGVREGIVEVLAGEPVAVLACPLVLALAVDPPMPQKLLGDAMPGGCAGAAEIVAAAQQIAEPSVSGVGGATNRNTPPR
jgi:hypothetical protein